MKEDEIREGDIVEIDYIGEFTKEHINEGKALVIWKGNNNQPLVRKLSTKKTIWTCYEHIARVVGHIDIEGYMDKALNIAESEKSIPDNEPKTGHWIPQYDYDGTPRIEETYDSVYECSICGTIDYETDYCSGCGAYMRGEE